MICADDFSTSQFEFSVHRRSRNLENPYFESRQKHMMVVLSRWFDAGDVKTTDASDTAPSVRPVYTVCYITRGAPMYL